MAHDLHYERQYRNAGFTQDTLTKKHDIIDVLPITIAAIDSEDKAYLIADLVKLSRIDRNVGEIMGAWKMMVARQRLCEDKFGVLDMLKRKVRDPDDETGAV